MGWFRTYKSRVWLQSGTECTDSPGRNSSSWLFSPFLRIFLGFRWDFLVVKGTWQGTTRAWLVRLFWFSGSFVLHLERWCVHVSANYRTCHQRLLPHRSLSRIKKYNSPTHPPPHLPSPCIYSTSTRPWSQTIGACHAAATISPPRVHAVTVGGRSASRRSRRCSLCQVHTALRAYTTGSELCFRSWSPARGAPPPSSTPPPPQQLPPLAHCWSAPPLVTPYCT